MPLMTLFNCNVVVRKRGKKGEFSFENEKKKERTLGLLMMITAFGATNVPAVTTKSILTITEIRETTKKTINAF